MSGSTLYRIFAQDSRGSAVGFTISSEISRGEEFSTSYSMNGYVFQPCCAPLVGHPLRQFIISR